MIPGETVASGAPGKCNDEGCPGAEGPMVCQSAAGYYVGYMCGMCGPYSRESDYYETHEEAEAAMLAGGYERQPGYLNPGTLKVQHFDTSEDLIAALSDSEGSEHE